jgi:FMN reductase (NADPH)
MPNTLAPILAPHRTVRAFRQEPLPDGLLERLVAEAQRAATDANGQMYCFVRVLAPGLRRTLAALAGDQEHVVTAAEFLVACADLQRNARVLRHRGFTPGEFPASGLHFAIVDAALAAQRLTDAAEAIRLGTCYIGGLLNGVEEVIDLLALPPGVLPLFGICLGWPAEAPRERPRVALTSVLHTDRYDAQGTPAIEADVAAMARTTRGGDWLKVLSKYFAAGGTMEAREASLRRALARQQFAWE